MRSRACDVAGTTSGPDRIILNFGATRPGDAGEGVVVALLQRIALRPLTAKHLQDMLQKLLAEAEANSRGAG